MTEATYKVCITYQVDMGEIDMTLAERKQLEKDRWNTIVGKNKFGIKVLSLIIEEVK